MSTSKPIIFVLPSLSAGGAERVLVNVANELSQDKQVYISEIRRSNDLQELVSDRVIQLSLGNKFIWILKIIWYVYRLKPCCLVSTNFDINSGLLLVKWLLPNSCALILREPVSVHAAETESKLPVLRHFAFKYLYRYADTLILLTDEMKNDFLRLFPLLNDKIRVIRNGVHGNRINVVVDNEKIKLFDKYIVAVGRLEYQKGFDVLIHAFDKLKDSYAEYGLVVIGEGSQKAALSKQIADLGIQDRVHLLGFVSNPLLIVRNASLFVLSSRYEGMSNALLEALCVGVPVVAVKKHTAAAEILATNKFAFMAEECSIPVLETALRNALDSMDNLNRDEIAEWAQSEFSFSKMLNNYRSVIDLYCET